MNEEFEILENALNHIKQTCDIVPSIAVVLGSGLKDFVNKIDIKHVIGYEQLDNFPTCTNPAHKGEFIIGYLNDIPLIVMNGRVHYYEGYSMTQVVRPIRLMRMLGAKTLILSNAVGSISSHIDVGDFMAIKDHISTFVPSPLIGANIDQLGTRFPDMSHVYAPDLCSLIKECGKKLNLSVKEGVLLQTTGPNYETPSEISFYSRLGADVVGMSTVTEAIAAVHCGFKVCGISLITNKAAGISDIPLSDDDVKFIAGKCANNFNDLLCLVIKNIKNE